MLGWYFAPERRRILLRTQADERVSVRIDRAEVVAGPNALDPTTAHAFYATGSATAQLNGDPGLWILTYEITYEGLSGPATVGHIHDAMRLFGIGHVTIQLERREMYERERHLHP